MKNKSITLLIIFLSFASISLHAQRPTQVKEVEETIIGESRGTAYQVGVYLADEKEILKELRSELKKKGGEVKVKGGILNATSLLMPLINSDTIAIIARAKEIEPSLHYLYVLFEDKEGNNIFSEDVSAHTAINAFLFDFANNLSINYAERDYNKKQKELESLEKKLKTEEREKENAEKNIVKYKKKVVKSEFLVEELKVEKEVTKDILAKKENAQKDIVSYSKKIRNLEYDVVESDKKQSELKRQIEKAKVVVNEAKKSSNVFK